MGATRNTGYLENLIQYDASDNVAIATSVNPSYKVTLGGSMLGTSAVFSSSNTATAFIPTGSTIPTNGMYLSAANTLNFATNSGSRLSISSTGAATFSSSVQIGTTPATAGSGLGIGLPFDTAIRWRNSTNTANLGFYLGGTNLFYFDAGISVNGAATFSSTLQATNIGINFAPQTDRLFVYNGSGTNVPIVAQQDGTGDIIRLNGNSGANRFVMTQSGAATFSSSVTATNTIQSNDQNAFWLFQAGNTTDTKYWAIQNLVTSGTFRIRALNDAVTNGINAIEISRSGISSVTTAFMGGNVGIGTTSPSYKLDVLGNTRIYGASGNDISLILASNGAAAPYMILNGSLNSYNLLRFQYNGSDYGGIGAFNGDITAGMSFYTGTSITERMRISSTGDLTVKGGTHTLYTNSGATISFDINVTRARFYQALTIDGALSKGSGSFRIKHPLESKKDTHQLVHSFIEGPQADLIYRGKIKLINGKAIINIDKNASMTEGTFESLCREVQCFTTNETGWNLVKGNIEGNLLKIESNNLECTDEISWIVIGERKDEHIMNTYWTDKNGKVIVEPLINE